MKRKILLTFVLAAFVTAIQAQKTKPVSAYAITGAEKGHHNWNEVRLVNVLTGEEVQSIYTASQQPELLNARTGKAIVKKEIAPATAERTLTEAPTRVKTSGGNTVIVIRQQTRSIASDRPFATNSAACAYDKKHERLYYTPMGIAQLRYIDLKAKTPKIYYFEEEAFGPLKSSRDVARQITRMVFASDGNGYALTNDAHHLIRFTTGKKPEITDLGALTDAPSNGAYTIHRSAGYGGDMIADNRRNLYLITASRSVYRISLESKQAEYLGNIQGLPKGYTTNGAAVDEDNQIIVCSSNSTQGYYRFALNDLKAEKFAGETVFNASDLANGNLLSVKKKKDKKEEKPVLDHIPDVVKEEVPDQPIAQPESTIGQTRAPQALSVYPNPVRTGSVKVSFAGQPAGRYQMQLIDLNGKVVSSRQIVIGSKSQVEEFKLPPLITAGSYLVKVTSEDGKVSMTGQVVVEK